MEIAKRYFDVRSVITIIYCLAFATYILVGLQPAEAVQHSVDGVLRIPSIELSVDVTALQLDGRELKTPDYIAGSYSGGRNKTLLIGHSTTAFKSLDDARIGDVVTYHDMAYKITEIEILPKVRISMSKLLSGSDKPTLVLMTCAGELLDNQDATHRLIVTSVAL